MRARTVSNIKKKSGTKFPLDISLFFQLFIFNIGETFHISEKIDFLMKRIRENRKINLSTLKQHPEKISSSLFLQIILLQTFI